MSASLKRRILEELENGPASAAFIAKVIGHERRSVAATLAALAKDELIGCEPGALALRPEAGRRPKLYRLR